jgi:hypothetical protein
VYDWYTLLLTTVIGYGIIGERWGGGIRSGGPTVTLHRARLQTMGCRLCRRSPARRGRSKL